MSLRRTTLAAPLRLAILRGAVTGCLVLVTLAAQQPRDGRRNPGAAGSATISGVVLTDDARPKPLRRVRVTLNNSGRTFGQTAITDDEGAFSFNGLAAGRYLVAAVKDGFVTMHHGARRPNRPGASIALGAGQRLAITLRLPSGGVISGAVTDPDGLPVPQLRVQAMTHQVVGGTDRRLMPIGNQQGGWTDDRGEYRIFGLPPGDYVVAAYPLGQSMAPSVLSPTEIRRALAEVRETSSRPGIGPPNRAARSPTPAEPRRTLSLAAVMYPGTTSLAHAAPVRLGPSEHRAGIDIQLQHVPVARVQGTVFSPSGPAGRIIVSLYLPGAETGSSFPVDHFRTVSANSLGAFYFLDVPPGQYTLLARTEPQPSRPNQWASTEIVVGGEDLADVVLSLRQGLTISGTVAFDSDRRPAFDLPGLEIDLPMEMAGATPVPAPRAALRLGAGGTFSLHGIVPGLYRMADGRGVRWPVGAWWIKSVVSGGRDLLDAPLELKQAADDVVVTFTDRVSEITGTVTDGDGLATEDGYVVAFAADRGLWFLGSRRVAGVRPAGDGRYRIRNLPPGDYFIAADQDIEEGEWADPAVLARLAPAAARITIAATETIALELRTPAR